ncbi:MAG: hypothetical protein ABSC71_07100, partial [Candidatus Acidiferrales bacterium]
MAGIRRKNEAGSVGDHDSGKPDAATPCDGTIRFDQASHVGHEKFDSFILDPIAIRATRKLEGRG